MLSKFNYGNTVVISRNGTKRKERKKSDLKPFKHVKYFHKFAPDSYYVKLGDDKLDQKHGQVYMNTNGPDKNGYFEAWCPRMSNKSAFAKTAELAITKFIKRSIS